MLRPHALTCRGTTSACAENTDAEAACAHMPGNYLRVCGEYRTVANTTWDLEELPPRARRIRTTRWYDHRAMGTTSACAENTITMRPPAAATPNYLRVRGEYPRQSRFGRAASELPPRARRILPAPIVISANNGTTSACAENTVPQDQAIGDKGNYLRVRGEYPTAPHCRRRLSELPPRARRIQAVNETSVCTMGTTSACAENTGRE